jgi:hypothetical protein
MIIDGFGLNSIGILLMSATVRLPLSAVMDVDICPKRIR